MIPYIAPWDAGLPAPSTERLAEPPGLRQVVVHRADAAYGFLHDNAITWHDGELVAAWYDCPRGEMEEISCIRARRSHDGGLYIIYSSEKHHSARSIVPVAALR